MTSHVEATTRSKLPTPSYQYEPQIITIQEWIHEKILKDLSGRLKQYFASLFPILSWIYRYNLTWAIGGTRPISLLMVIRSDGWFDGWLLGRASKYGICENCHVTSPIWTLLFLRRRFHLLLFRDIKRRHYWSCRDHGASNCSRDCVGPKI